MLEPLAKAPQTPSRPNNAITDIAQAKSSLLRQTRPIIAAGPVSPSVVREWYTWQAAAYM